MSNAMPDRGILVTVEGIDGCGKSTQARLIARALEHAGRDVLTLREPGGVAISEKVRALLLDPANAEMDEVCELLLYEAARAQLVAERIRPALAEGKVVVCDRFFDSTTCYQGFAGGLDHGDVMRANALAVGECRPALTLVYDIDPALAARRRAGREGAEDRIEARGLAYQERVSQGFRAIAAAEPDRVRLIDAARGVGEVFADTLAALATAGLHVSQEAASAVLAEEVADDARR